MEETIFSTGWLVAKKNVALKREYELSFEIPSYTLNEDTYYFEMFWGVNRSEVAFKFTDIGFEVFSVENALGEIVKSPGILAPNIIYNVHEI